MHPPGQSTTAIARIARVRGHVRRPRMGSRRTVYAYATLAFVAVVTPGCDRTLSPQRSRLTDLRQQAEAGFGSFFGRVRVLETSQPCHRATLTVAGIRVELGLWDGTPAFYRDTITREVPTTLDESRFQLLATTTSDSEGRFSFVQVPRGFPYALRAIPPEGSRWGIAYGGTLYGPPTGGDLQDFPTLCLPART